MWDLNVLIHDHRLSVYFEFIKNSSAKEKKFCSC